MQSISVPDTVGKTFCQSVFFPYVAKCPLCPKM